MQQQLEQILNEFGIKDRHYQTGKCDYRFSTDNNNFIVIGGSNQGGKFVDDKFSFDSAKNLKRWLKKNIY